MGPAAGVTLPAKMALATRNAGKIREIARIWADTRVEWVTFEQAHWPEVQETGGSYLENALLKARAVAEALELPALADDSGIEVDALGGRPGIGSARFAGERASHRENLELMIARMRDVAPEDRTARYRCVAVCAWPYRRKVWADGRCEGRLITEPRGEGGFGYDPIFVPEGFDRTMAELSPVEKDAISHRGKALRALRDAVAGAVSGARTA